MRKSNYKYQCDKCKKNTIINGGDRMTWFIEKNESLCASCYRELPEDVREITRKVTNLKLKIYFAYFKHWITSGTEGSITYELNPEELEIMREFEKIGVSKKDE